MLKLLADENIPKKISILLKKLGIDIIRLQDLGIRGISDRELIRIANEHNRTILTRDFDFTTPSLLSLARNGVIYISYQPSRNEILGLVKRIASIADRLKPKPGLLIIIEREYTEVYE